MRAKVTTILSSPYICIYWDIFKVLYVNSREAVKTDPNWRDVKGAFLSLGTIRQPAGLACWTRQPAWGDQTERLGKQPKPFCKRDAAKSLQSCRTLCDPIDGSPPGSPVPGTLQARTVEWVAISFSSAWKWKVKVKLLSRVRLPATPWTAAYQAPLPMGVSCHARGIGLLNK